MKTIAEPVASHRTATLPLTLDGLLALRGLAMDERLGDAGVECDVRTAGINIPEILVDPMPATTTAPPRSAAELLEQACDLMTTRGWCRRWLTDADGAVCLIGAIRTAGGGSGHEARAEELLLAIVQAEFPDAQTIGGWNDGQTNGRPALRMLDRAARHADRHGI